MPKTDESTESVYRVTEVIGASAKSWEEAAKNAVHPAVGYLSLVRLI
jgi:flavin-binding protein dodecin